MAVQQVAGPAGRGPAAAGRAHADPLLLQRVRAAARRAALRAGQVPHRAQGAARARPHARAPGGLAA